MRHRLGPLAGELKEGSRRSYDRHEKAYRKAHHYHGKEGILHRILPEHREKQRYTLSSHIARAVSAYIDGTQTAHHIEAVLYAVEQQEYRRLDEEPFRVVPLEEHIDHIPHYGVHDEIHGSRDDIRQKLKARGQKVTQPFPHGVQYLVVYPFIYTAEESKLYYLHTLYSPFLFPSDETFEAIDFPTIFPAAAAPPVAYVTAALAAFFAASPAYLAMNCD